MHNTSGGQWTEHKRIHINVLEVKATFLGICTYCHNRIYKHTRILSDSSTVIAYINNKGGIESKK